MQFNSTNHETADIKLLAFEYGGPSKNEEEDWLEISLNLITTHNKFHVIDPALTAAEVRQLALWLYDLYCNKTEVKDLYFLEPNLSFHFLHAKKKGTIIRICFNAELRPSWAKAGESYSIVCRILKEDLQNICAHLLQDLNRLYEESKEVRED